MNIKHCLWLGCAASLLLSASADAMVLPGFAGLADPPAENGLWLQDIGRLTLCASGTAGCATAADQAWHRFTVSIPVKESSLVQDLQVSWQHTIDGAQVLGGDAQGRLIVFDQAGLISGAPSAWDGTLGPVQKQMNLPAGGTAIFQARLKDLPGLGVHHYISRVFSHGTAAI